MLRLLLSSLVVVAVFASSPSSPSSPQGAQAEVSTGAKSGVARGRYGGYGGYQGGYEAPSQDYGSNGGGYGGGYHRPPHFDLNYCSAHASFPLVGEDDNYKNYDRDDDRDYFRGNRRNHYRRRHHYGRRSYDRQTCRYAAVWNHAACQHCCRAASRSANTNAEEIFGALFTFDPRDPTGDDYDHHRRGHGDRDDDDDKHDDKYEHDRKKRGAKEDESPEHDGDDDHNRDRDHERYKGGLVVQCVCCAPKKY